MTKEILAGLEELVRTTTTSGDLTQRYRQPLGDAEPEVQALAKALNALFDKLWLQDFQITAKQEMLEKVVEIRTREVHEILDNVSTGFLIARPDETIFPNDSRSCTQIFGDEAFDGRKLSELMGLSERDAFNFSAAWEQIFSDFLPVELCIDQLPADFTLHGRSYRLDVSPITDGDDRVQKLFVTISDTTELRKVEAENALRLALLHIVRQREAFRAFLADTCRALEEVRAEPQQSAMRATLHTVKGNLGCFGLHEMAALVHSIEDRASIQLADLDAVEVALRSFLDTHADVIDVRWPGSDHVTAVDVDRLMPLLDEIAHEDSEAVRERRIEDFLAHVSWVPAGTLLASLHGLVERISARLEKEVVLEVLGDDVLVDPEWLGPVFSSLVHLVRNSLDHGIEDAWERGDKPAEGHISIQCEAVDGEWIIRARDDGRGIDVDGISQRAVELGLVDEAELAEMDEEQKLRLIFLDNLTTKHEATDVSGRGVGTSALLKSLEAVNGRVAVHSEPGRGTRFTMRVPRPQAPKHAASN